MAAVSPKRSSDPFGPLKEPIRMSINKHSYSMAISAQVGIKKLTANTNTTKQRSPYMDTFEILATGRYPC